MTITHRRTLRAYKAAALARVAASALATAMVVGCSLPASMPGLGSSNRDGSAAAPQDTKQPDADAPALRTTAAAPAADAEESESEPATTSVSAEPALVATAAVATEAAAPDATDEDGPEETLGGSAADDFGAALSLAYATNPTLQAQRAAVNAALQDVAIARSERFPQLSATVDYDIQDTQSVDNGEVQIQDADGNFITFPLDEFETTRRTNTLNYGLNASQAVYQGGRVRAGIDAARADVEAARAQLNDTAQTVLVEAITAYVNTRRDQEVVTIRLNNVEVLTRQLRAARDRLEFGEGTVTDVAQAEARLAGARTELAAAQSDLAATRATYERVIGQAPATLSAPPDLPALPQSLDAAEGEALNNNPQVVAARFAEASARANVRSARSAFRPSVSLDGRISRQQTDGESEVFVPTEIDQRDDVLSGGVSASIPLFTGGANGARVRQARASESQARLQVREAERLAREAVVSAWNALIAARVQIVSSEEQVRANEVALQGVRDEAEFGQRTTLDVLDAEQELLDSRLALVTAESDAYVAAFQLLQAAGALDAGALRLSTAP